MQSTTNPKRLLLEGVVVVASILIAFALDAWWDERQEDRRLHAELLGISEEISENRGRIDFQLDLVERFIQGGDALIEAAEAATSGNVSLPDTIAWLAVAVSTLDLSLGAVDAMIQSGGLRSIENTRLAVRLAGLRDQVIDVREEQVLVREVQHRMMAHVEGGQWIATNLAISRPFWARDRVPGQPVPSFGDVTLPVDPRLLDMIRRRNMWFSVSVGELVRLREELDVIEAMIESEIGGM